MVKGGCIYNGSGMPSFVGDVAVKGGRVAEIGRVKESAMRTI
jgi:N-acyl-D-aspartate/D-glutamate deacylase